MLCYINDLGSERRAIAIYCIADIASTLYQGAGPMHIQMGDSIPGPDRSIYENSYILRSTPMQFSLFFMYFRYITKIQRESR